MKNSAKRLKEILSVFKKYHFPKEITPEKLKLALEDLGPTFIKMGQIMASREDLIPKEYCQELARLRSSVKPMPYQTVKSILEGKYNCKLEKKFKEFSEEPIGSASIAQVHKAKLLDGTLVAVKVQREQIEELMKIDMNLLKKAISILHLNKFMGDIIDLVAVVDEMYIRAKEEMDFNIELQHIKEFTKNNQDLIYIKSIKVYEDLSSSNILVMEYIEGNKINEVSTLNKLGYDLNEIGEKLAHNYIKQAIDDGFYHADPHSDNIKIIDGKIAYLDFGMMGSLSKYSRELLEECIKAIVSDDIALVARILVLLDTKKDAVDYMKLKNDIKMVLEKNKKAEISSIDIKSFTSEIFALLQENAITLPKEITMLIRGIVVLEGTLEEISPKINLIQVLEKRFDYTNILNKSKVRDFFLNSLKGSSNLMLIPNELLTTLKGVNSGELRFNIELTDSKHQIDRIERIVHLIIITVLDVAFIIGTSQMIVKIEDNLPIIFHMYLLGAIICTAWLLYKLLMSKFRKY